MTISQDERFLFLGTKLGYVTVFDLHEYEMVTDRLIKLSASITAMAYDAKREHLLIGSEDGAISQFYVFDGLTEMKQSLVERKMGRIDELAKENPMLSFTDIYKKAIQFWEISLDKARTAFENGNKEKGFGEEIIKFYNGMVQFVRKYYANFYEKFGNKMVFVESFGL